MYADHWLYLATLEIRFPPDREAVQQELRDHLDDKIAAYMDRGLTRQEAEYAAVEDMGDPEPVAQELGRIHRPWWGYFWRASRVVLILAAICTAAAVLGNVGYWSGSFLFSQPELPEGDTIVTQFGIEKSVVEKWRPAGSKMLRNYRFTVPMAWIETWEVEYEDEDGTMVHNEPCHLVVCLRADTWRFWEPSSASQLMILDNTATDSQGNQYVYDGERTDCRGFFCMTWQNSFTTWYQVDLYLTGPEDPPEWVEIPVGYGGDKIRVDLKSEVVS